MGPKIQLTMVARRYIMRGIYNSTRSWLLLVDMSCAMLDKNVVEDRKKREYGSEKTEKDGMDKSTEYTGVVKGLFRRLEAILTRRNLKACIH